MKTQKKLRPIAGILIFSIICTGVGLIQAEDVQENFRTHDALVSELLKRLKNKSSISGLLNHDITFIYHSDNRCDGSTDGKITKLSRAKFDVPFSIQVTNTGDGWACDKKQASTFIIEFHLTDKLSNWDRLESGQHDPKKNTIYVYGGGESDYMVFHFTKNDGNYIIDKVEYRSEDPG